MDEQLFKTFLFKSENDSIDFKKEQYKFILASDDDKSELLKDILAMVNSWRQETGYIIIGIKDKPDKPNDLMGISEHIDDAQLQQFVNKKLNNYCRFEYKTFSYKLKVFGIIKIPVQNRPVYLKKDFVKLKKETVYVRRGSSTDIAKIEEISQMGISLPLLPQIDINFYNDNSGITIGKTIDLISDYYIIENKIPTLGGSGIYVPALTNRNYYTEYYEHINFIKAYSKIHFLLTNNGDIEAKGLIIEMKFQGCDFDILTNGNRKYKPSTSVTTFLTNSPFDKFPNVDINKTATTITMEIENIHAKRNFIIKEPIYLNPKTTKEIKSDVKIYCDGLQEPIEYSLKYSFIQNQHKMKWNNFSDQFNIR